MNLALPAPFSARVAPASLRKAPVRKWGSPAQLHYVTLIEVLVCLVPSMVLLAVGELRMSAYALFVPLVVLLFYHTLMRQALDALSLAVGLIPVMMLLRGLFVYNSLQFILAGCFVMALGSASDRARLLRNRPLVWLTGTCTVYWLVSFVITGEYTSNSRMVELALASASVFLLMGHRSRMATAAVGIAVSGLLMAAAMMPYGARLGMVSGVSDVTIGNPITLGLSASVGYLLTIADRGKWMLLHQRPLVRLALGLLAGAALVLSTSRGSWLVTLMGTIVILFLNKEGRRPLLWSLLLLAVLTAILLQTKRGAAISHYFDNAVGEDQTLEKRTTGRANQWESMPAVLHASLLWGFGPGSGRDVSRRFTKEGKPWHSLYLLAGAETGLPGMMALLVLLGVLTVRTVRHLRATGEIVPLMALIGFSVIGVSTSGMDAISGVFLGYAFGGGDYTGLVRMRVGLATGAGPTPDDAGEQSAPACDLP